MRRSMPWWGEISGALLHNNLGRCRIRARCFRMNQKYFGWRKVAQISDQVHPLMATYHRDLYGGVAWANELAKRGYAVLAHDAFAFASRRVRVGEVPPVLRKGLKEVNPESEEEIRAY